MTATVDGAPTTPVGPRRSSRAIVLAVLAVVVALGAVFAVRLASGPAEEGPSQLGSPAPPLDLVDLDGAPVTSADLAGRTVLVNFWNTWCLPCRQEEPALAAFAERYGDDPNVALLAVVRDDEEADVRRYVAERSTGWTVVFDPGQRAALGFATRGQPETYAVSPSGVVAASQYGPASVADLEAMFNAARATG